MKLYDGLIRTNPRKSIRYYHEVLQLTYTTNTKSIRISRKQIHSDIIESSLSDNLLLLDEITTYIQRASHMLSIDDTNLECSEYFKLKSYKQFIEHEKSWYEIIFRRLQQVIPKKIALVNPKNITYVVGNKPIEYRKYDNQIIIYTGSPATELLHKYLNKFRFSKIRSLLNVFGLS